MPSPREGPGSRLLIGSCDPNLSRPGELRSWAWLRGGAGPQAPNWLPSQLSASLSCRSTLHAPLPALLPLFPSRPRGVAPPNFFSSQTARCGLWPPCQSGGGGAGARLARWAHIPQASPPPLNGCGVPGASLPGMSGDFLPSASLPPKARTQARNTFAHRRGQVATPSEGPPPATLGRCGAEGTRGAPERVLGRSYNRLCDVLVASLPESPSRNPKAQEDSVSSSHLIPTLGSKLECI